MMGINYRHKIISIILVFLSSKVVAYNLLDLYTAAYANDPTILVARENYKIAMQALPKAKVNFLPTISSTSYSTATDSSDPLFRQYNNWGSSIDIKQTVFSARSWNELKQAGYTVQSAAAVLAEAEQQLFLRVALAYFLVLKAEDELTFSKSEKRAFEQQCIEAKQKLKVGLIPITDVHEAQAKYDMANAAEIAATNRMRNEKERLKELTGHSIDNIVSLQAGISLAYPSPNNIEHWIEEAVKNNWQLESLRQNLKVVKAQIDNEKSRHLPEVSLNGTLVRSKQPPPLSTKASSESIGVQFSLPIFSGGGVIVGTREARHKYAKAAFEFEGALREVTNTTTFSFRNMITKVNQVNALQQAIVSSNAALKATQAAYRVGTRTIVDLLAAPSNAR